MVKTILAVLVLVLVGGLVVVGLAGRGTFGRHEGPGTPTAQTRPASSVRATSADVQEAAVDVGVRDAKQVLFGDLHVHTSFSFDAFMLSLPVSGGEGSRPPADACDFARFCSALDFWSINDHAFSVTPQHWNETVDAIRQCNDVAGESADPDTVAFLGWEWTQVGLTPDAHYGHKNVVLRHTDDANIPARPIGAMRDTSLMPGVMARGVGALLGGDRFDDLALYFTELGGAAACDGDAPVHDLPGDCVEIADTPADLYRKLDEWGHDALVIPHGTTWGFYTPPGSTWDKQLKGPLHDPDRQTLLEIYSGHGDSEVYRDFRAVDLSDPENPRCPEPTPDYLPTCWQAGEIIRGRCLAEGVDDSECELRAVAARAHAVAAGQGIARTVRGWEAEDWLDAGQCRDCAEPSFNYRPGGSAQYILAISNFDKGAESPRRFRMGFLSSSDNHYARPGTGYKEEHRRGMTESRGNVSAGGLVARTFLPPEEEATSRSEAFLYDAPGFNVFETERQTSFFLTGGLAAVHAEGRDRDAIWQALERREVYGTSGPRMLLWFDLLNPPGSRGKSLPMGGDAVMRQSPIFQVRAVGSFEQQPGCPDYAEQALGDERLQSLCKGECHHPSDRRRLISRIEVVRIRPQERAGEPVADLIDDPWQTFACQPDPTGCVVTFSDSEFVDEERDTLYYARAFEEPKPGINAGNLRCKRDADGNCTEVDLCPGPDGDQDDCLAPHEPRAWSSPIYVDYADLSAEMLAD